MNSDTESDVEDENERDTEDESESDTEDEHQDLLSKPQANHNSTTT